MHLFSVHAYRYLYTASFIYLAGAGVVPERFSRVQIEVLFPYVGRELRIRKKFDGLINVGVKAGRQPCRRWGVLDRSGDLVAPGEKKTKKTNWRGISVWSLSLRRVL